MKKYFTLNSTVQVGLIAFTMLGFLLTSFKLPKYGLIANLISEIFWLYSSYKAWKNADHNWNIYNHNYNYLDCIVRNH